MTTRTKKTPQHDIDTSLIDAAQVPKKITPILLTGYQFNAQGTFIGVYEFEKNMDKEEVHMPPRTTLLPPPCDLPIDQEAFFDGEKWVTRNQTLSGFPDRELPPKQEENQEINDVN